MENFSAVYRRNLSADQMLKRVLSVGSSNRVTRNWKCHLVRDHPFALRTGRRSRRTANVVRYEVRGDGIVVLPLEDPKPQALEPPNSFSDLQFA